MWAVVGGFTRERRFTKLCHWDAKARKGVASVLVGGEVYVLITHLQAGKPSQGVDPSFECIKCRQDNLRQVVGSLPPEDCPLPVVLMGDMNIAELRGLGEHTGQYLDMVTQFAQCGLRDVFRTKYPLPMNPKELIDRRHYFVTADPSNSLALFFGGQKSDNAKSCGTRIDHVFARNLREVVEAKIQEVQTPVHDNKSLEKRQCVELSDHNVVIFSLTYVQHNSKPPHPAPYPPTPLQ
eukprot:TRINITY_DN3000_c0_g1_i1.p1 TRINITY_DN3000_c0_g1~~TRINITY_DN3000_c0_g1_i1.p1  ORF type:complete len:237 (-),score=41.84 TRINITY_DN3000_c0_g1_i1:34-744(-)